jgi:hypothetical protein
MAVVGSVAAGVVPAAVATGCQARPAGPAQCRKCKGSAAADVTVAVVVDPFRITIADFGHWRHGAVLVCPAVLQEAPPQICYNEPKLMKPLVAKIKPVRGVSSLLHYGLLLAFPAILFVLVRLDFVPLAFVLVALSKWRMFVVRPRFWLANIRANSIDILVGISSLVFMTQTPSASWQFVWALAYAAWLILLKPGSSVLYTSLQAGVGYVAGLMALYIAWGGAPLYTLVLATGMVSFLAARHFFDSFDEPYARLLSYLWGYFGAALVWLLGHMLIVYPRQTGYVAQPLLFLAVVGVGLAAAYYLDHFDRFAGYVKRQILFVSGGIILLLLISLYYEGSNLLLR